MDANGPQFDPDRSTALVGKVLLIGVTYLDRAGKMVAQRQWVGRISQASNDGIVVHLDDSEQPCVLPPDPRAFHPAKPGTYRLRHTGRVVIDPDLITTWTHREEVREATKFAPPSFSSEWVYRVDDPPPDSDRTTAKDG